MTSYINIADQTCMIERRNFDIFQSMLQTTKFGKKNYWARNDDGFKTEIGNSYVDL